MIESYLVILKELATHPEDNRLLHSLAMGKTMKYALFVTAIAFAFPTLTLAWDSPKELTEVTFAGIDGNGNGELDFSEISSMAESISASMDSNSDDLISRTEFAEWDIGYAYLAERNGKSDLFAAAKRIMFALRDLNNDGKISIAEARKNIFRAFERADLDGDGALSESEFSTAWTPIIVLKAAFKG